MWAVVVRGATEDADLIVEAHLEFTRLVFVLTHQSKVDVTLYNLPDVFDGNLRVVLRLALDLFRLLTDILPGSPDVLVCFKVSLVRS